MACKKREFDKGVVMKYLLGARFIPREGGPEVL